MEHVVMLLMTLWWFVGPVLIKGAWLTVLGIFVPPYAMYIAAEFAFKFLSIAAGRSPVTT
jgi:hypothetical protein